MIVGLIEVVEVIVGEEGEKRWEVVVEVYDGWRGRNSRPTTAKWWWNNRMTLVQWAWPR